MEEQKQTVISQAWNTYFEYIRNSVNQEFKTDHESIDAIRDAYLVGISVEWASEMVTREHYEEVYKRIILKAKNLKYQAKTDNDELLEEQAQNILKDYQIKLYNYYTSEICKYCIN